MDSIKKNANDQFVINGQVSNTPKFCEITNTFKLYAAYNSDDNFNLSVVVPLKDGKGYNETTGNFETIAKCGVIVAPEAALEKYGFTIQDLTLQNVNEWKATDHDIAKYVVAFDNVAIPNVYEEIYSVNFAVTIADVSLADRRESNTCVVCFADFADAAGKVSGSVVNAFAKPLDNYVYGDTLPKKFVCKKGINYSGPGISSELPAFEDVRSKGFDSIRMPLRAYLDKNGRLPKSSLVYYFKRVQNALKCGMPVIVDMHAITYANGERANISADYSSHAQAFYDAWDDLARYFANYPESVIFQLFNEPRIDIKGPDQITIPEMMEMQEKLIDQVRAIPGNENRMIVLGSDVNYPKDMDKDFPDSLLSKGNLMIDFHYYTPMDFTHTWEGHVYPAGAKIATCNNGKGLDFNHIKETMAYIKDFGERKGVEVLMGEWGAYHPDYDDKLIYYTAMVDAMREYDIPWTIWGYTEPYSGYVDGKWDEKLLEIYFEKKAYYLDD